MTIDHDIRSAILITDADNTLWDTNKVFADAQLNLLAGIEEAFFRRSRAASQVIVSPISAASIKSWQNQITAA